MDKMMRFRSAVKHDGAIDVWFGKHAQELRALARPWFEQMRACGDDVRELMHDGNPTACVQDAAFGYVGIYTSHANVGFFHGAALSDPAGLLEGTGKRMRHVKLRLGHTVDPVALGKLVDAAYIDIKLRLRT
jgi:hypothetical protein